MLLKSSRTNAAPASWKSLLCNQYSEEIFDIEFFFFMIGRQALVKIVLQQTSNVALVS